ncbi:hypothetical protein OU415_16055 [Saccharopolyspora sp. WRP15-2]|uniref:Integral membrane protein n=1 Tax=Saccharopolyspora oryzae TaxID=2997343 RepID=A0ABT4UZ07_9PSEU|nr:hypothetical protein [Saccharopolyspora oryzae]MDA3626959.1 hypothetical protein [Saccharopolyspora oryzae]
MDDSAVSADQVVRDWLDTDYGRSLRDGLPPMRGFSRKRVVERIAAAYCRDAAHAGHWWSLAKNQLFGVVLMFCVASVLAWRVNEMVGHSSPTVVLTTASIFAGFILACGATLLATARRWGVDTRTFYLEGKFALAWVPRRAATVFLALACAGWPVYAAVYHQPYFWLPYSPLEDLAALAASFLVTGPMWLQRINASTREQRRVLGRPQPLDLTACQLATVAVLVRKCASGPVNRRLLRRASAGLERAARTAETFSVHQVPLLDRASRREARREGMRLAATIRAQKAPMARGTSSELDQVGRALSAWLGTWAKGDIDALLQNSPEVTPADRLRPLLRHLFWALVLAALGFLVRIPALHVSDEVAGNAQLILWGSAAITLLSGVVPPPPPVTAALDKVLAPIQKPQPPDQQNNRS